MRQKHPLLYRIAVAGLVAGLGVAAIAYANDDGAPSNAQIAFSQQVSDLMVNELVQRSSKSSTRPLHKTWSTASRPSRSSSTT